MLDGWLFPPPEDPPNSGVKPASPALAGRFSTTGPPGKPNGLLLSHIEETDCAEKWADLDTVIQSEVSQKERNKHQVILLICGI